jgi:hypothetical protein
MTDTSHSRTGTAHHQPDSPEALEQEVNAERSRVAETLDALQDKMSVGNVVDEAVRSFSRYGGDMAGNFGRQVRNNPLPLLLTGIGLAWLMTSSGSSRPRRYDEDYLWDVEDDDLYEEDLVGTRRYGTAAGVRPYGTAGTAGTYADDSPSTTERVSGAAGSAASGVGGAASSAGRGIGSAASGAGHAAGSAASGIGGAAGSAARGTRDAAGSAASGVSHAAGSAASGIGRAAGAVRSGVGSAASGAAGAVSSGARGAYYGARHTGDSVRDGAYRASRGAYEAGRSSVRRLDEMIQDHPLAMGALAVAAGAAIGGALPRTRTEDEYIGEYSDHAKDAARETVERESEKARRVAGAVAGEARTIYDEKAEEVDRRLKDAANEGRSATERAKAEASGAAERLRDAARSEAERQNLGDPKKPS